MKIRNSVYVALIVGASAVLAPVYGPSIAAHAASTTQEDMDRSVKSLLSVYSIMEQNYADSVSSEKAFYQGAIPGMLRTLDPHSNFLDPAEWQDMQRKQRANYSGIGMLISMDGGKVVAMEPFVGSPAWKADLRRGDVIVAVDGKDATHKDSQAVADMLRGPTNTQVQVTVKREGVPEALTKTVTRGGIETSVVDCFWARPGVAFLSVTTFEAQNVAKDVEGCLGKLGEDKIKGLVLDLRENRGGLVTEAVSLAGRFLHDGQVVVSHHGRAEKEQVFRARGNTAAQKYPVVVMVNGNSASASEIVSGALQDHDRAWILGSNTFGKGLVQAQFPLSEGGALLLTIAHYYTPSGRLIQRDYSHQSFYDYYTAGGKGGQNMNDVKSTDTGRKMYGGGGIAPDEKYEAPKLSLLERRINPTYTNYLFRFGNAYFLNGEKPHLPEDWEPDESTMNRFKDFLHTQGVPFTDADFNRDSKWLKDQVRFELYLRAFDKKTAERANFLSDPELQRAIDSLPQAQTLLSEAQKTLARRQ